MSDSHATAVETAANPELRHHFADMRQQTNSASLGMWLFLVTEIMFFGGLFMAYLVYRTAQPEGFAEASHHLNVMWGAVNTVVLIVSSLTMALGVRAAQTSAPPKTQALWIGATMVLGAIFLDQLFRVVRRLSRRLLVA